MTNPGPRGGLNRRVLPYGDDAVLIECRHEDPHALAAACALIPEVMEAVPAAETVLVEFRPEARGRRAQLIDELLGLPARGVGGDGWGTSPSIVVDLPIVYDGPDLGAVAARLSMGVEDVISLHSSAIYTAAFCGFAPGFSYLRGLPTELTLPRLASPRSSVPSGSLAIADRWSAIYPTDSPGGWHLIGRLAVESPSSFLFDSGRLPEPALLGPGTTVRFLRVEA